MTFTAKDKIALPLGIVIGTAFGYFTMSAGFGGGVVAGLYGILIVPLVVIYLADQRKLLIWQSCILPYALYIAIEGEFPPAGMFWIFWAMVTVLSSPAPVFFCWKRRKISGGSRLVWLSVGPALAGLTFTSLPSDPFLLFSLTLLWIVACVGKFSWDWRAGVDTTRSKPAALIAVAVLIAGTAGAASITMLRKQQAFSSAMDNQYFGIARSFVNMGADPNAPNASGQPALIRAAWMGDTEGVDALISMGADVNRVQGGAFSGLMPSGTALHVAASAGRIQICASLLESGASVNAKGQQGATPLLAALSNSSVPCVPILLHRGADVNATDVRGRTALMYLMRYDPNNRVIQSILREMVDKGADLDAKDAEGKSVGDWAQDNRHERFRELLQNLRDSKGRNN